MPSPFTSVSRKRSRLGQSRRLKTVAALAVVALFATVVPAVAAPHAFSSSLSPIAIAKKALKLATGANKTAKSANKTAKSADKTAKTALATAKQGPADNSVTTNKIADANVTGADLAAGAVGPGKIAPGTIGSDDIAANAIGPGKVAAGAIQAADIGDGQVPGIKITDGSVTTADLSGADITETIHADAGAVPSHSCVTTVVDMAGARVGDAAFLTFVGTTPVPPGLTFELLKVSNPDSGTLRLCNPTSVASTAFSDVGVRIIALH